MKLRSFLLTATTLTGVASTVLADDLSFAPVAVPTDDAAKRVVVVSQSITMNGTTAPIGYHVLARSGDMFGDTMFAQLHDIAGNPVAVPGSGAAASSSADFTSLLHVGAKLFSLTQFEELPAAVYLSEVDQDDAGKLSITASKPVDLSSVGGLWLPCAGSVTPWNTHLGSEEYPTDARAHEAAQSLAGLAPEVLTMGRYFGLDETSATLDDYRAQVNPYRYGFNVEYTLSEAGEVAVVKHGAMGRFSVEVANVLPDNKTAYMSDDGTNVALYRFVADKAGDLSAGALYAARWNQTSDQNGGAADIEWVDLGHADDATILAAIDKGTRFSDMFETAEYNSDDRCPDGFLSSTAVGSECLKIKPGMEAVASRLETRRVASMKGATTEFRKMEGNVYNPDRNSLYLAMSEIGKGMLDGDARADLGGRNDVRLTANSCGAVYELALDEGYVATNMTAILTGKPMEYAAGSPYAGNSCDVDAIASPDNVTYIPGQNTLIIAEDTFKHQNDAIWAMNTGTSVLTRIATTPYGAEATSVDWYPSIGGHGYLVAVVQHPFGPSDTDKLIDPAEANAYIGYIGPFPVTQ
ncbi:MAG: alkaline phosphatase PhoX [Albidovulum sp.]